uniref:hypothetical protein n=1 Tax=Flavobacteriaceae TaxID=49546 RepID=UPI004047D50E
MNTTKREIKQCYNKLDNCYLVYVCRQGKSNWNDFTVDKNTLEQIIKHNFKFSGDDYKLNPYKPYFKYLIEWNIKIYWKRFLSLNEPLTKIFDSGFSKAILFILVVMTYYLQINQNKSIEKEINEIQPNIYPTELHQEPIKPIEIYYQENYGIDAQKPNNEALKYDSLTKHKNDSLK